MATDPSAEDILAQAADVGRPTVSRKTIADGGKACDHRTFAVDDRALKVHCRSCGVEVEAIRVVIDIAKRYDNLSYEAQRYRATAACASRDVERLKRQRRNLQAQVKRMGEKTGD